MRFICFGLAWLACLAHGQSLQSPAYNLHGGPCKDSQRYFNGTNGNQAWKPWQALMMLLLKLNPGSAFKFGCQQACQVTPHFCWALRNCRSCASALQMSLVDPAIRSIGVASIGSSGVGNIGSGCEFDKQRLLNRVRTVLQHDFDVICTEERRAYPMAVLCLQRRLGRGLPSMQAALKKAEKALYQQHPWDRWDWDFKPRSYNRKKIEKACSALDLRIWIDITEVEQDALRLSDEQQEELKDLPPSGDELFDYIGSRRNNADVILKYEPSEKGSPYLKVKLMQVNTGKFPKLTLKTNLTLSGDPGATLKMYDEYWWPTQDMVLSIEMDGKIDKENMKKHFQDIACNLEGLNGDDLLPDFADRSSQGFVECMLELNSSDRWIPGSLTGSGVFHTLIAMKLLDLGHPSMKQKQKH